MVKPADSNLDVNIYYYLLLTLISYYIGIMIYLSVSLYHIWLNNTMMKL